MWRAIIKHQGVVLNEISSIQELFRISWSRKLTQEWGFKTSKASEPKQERPLKTIDVKEQIATRIVMKQEPMSDPYSLSTKQDTNSTRPR